MRNYVALGLLLGAISACRSDSSSIKTIAPTYFDISGYFKKEAAKYEARNQPVYKTVERNGQSESKKISEINWRNEFSLFVESDINKPAWIDQYEVSIRQDTTIYLRKDSTLKTQRITLVRHQDQIQTLEIMNNTSNALYHSQERLYYVPDSIYTIEKKQSVRFLGENEYRITGQF